MESQAQLLTIVKKAKITIVTQGQLKLGDLVLYSNFLTEVSSLVNGSTICTSFIYVKDKYNDHAIFDTKFREYYKIENINDLELEQICANCGEHLDISVKDTDHFCESDFFCIHCQKMQKTRKYHDRSAFLECHTSTHYMIYTCPECQQETEVEENLM